MKKLLLSFALLATIFCAVSAENDSAAVETLRAAFSFNKASFDVSKKELTLNWATKAKKGANAPTSIKVSYKRSDKSEAITRSYAVKNGKGSLVIKNPEIKSVYYKPYVYDDKHIGAGGESGVYNDYKSGNLDGMSVDDCMSQIDIEIEAVYGDDKKKTSNTPAKYLFTLNVDQTTSREYFIANSMEELMPYLKINSNDKYVRMAPGVYTIDAAYMKAGKYTTAEELGDKNWVIMQIMGNGNYFDFTGVRLDVLHEAVVLKNEVVNLQTIGSNNVIRGLEIRDLAKDNVSVKGYVNIKIDGAANRLERVYVYSVGSYPYGYGALFGLGTSSRTAIKNISKHSSLLIRGKSNHIKDCYLHHRAFGHFLFFQGVAGDTVVEGVYILGEINTTDNILAERGTGSPADLVNFVMNVGRKVPRGYSISIGEDAVRTYANGMTTYDNKTPFAKMNTVGTITAKNCYMQHTRNATQLRFGSHKGYVYNCKSVGCQQGFVLSNGGVGKHLYADTQFGPAAYMWFPDKNTELDVTLIPYEGGKKAYGGGFIGFNAYGKVVGILGSNNNVTIKQHPDYVNDQNLTIDIGLPRNSADGKDGETDPKAIANKITDYTDVPILLGSQSKSNVITRTNTTKGVTDNGAENKY
ncbi:MAG: hypothetical protein SNH35_00630 [Rikenellaceae bacterium]